jgi:hypothetical protein
VSALEALQTKHEGVSVHPGQDYPSHYKEGYAHGYDGGFSSGFEKGMNYGFAKGHEYALKALTQGGSLNLPFLPHIDQSHTPVTHTEITVETDQQHTTPGSLFGIPFTHQESVIEHQSVPIVHHEIAGVDIVPLSHQSVAHDTPLVHEATTTLPSQTTGEFFYVDQPGLRDLHYNPQDHKIHSTAIEHQLTHDQTDQELALLHYLNPEGV